MLAVHQEQQTSLLSLVFRHANLSFKCCHFPWGELSNCMKLGMFFVLERTSARIANNNSPIIPYLSTFQNDVFIEPFPMLVWCPLGPLGAGSPRPQASKAAIRLTSSGTASLLDFRRNLSKVFRFDHVEKASTRCNHHSTLCTASYLASAYDGIAYTEFFLL